MAWRISPIFKYTVMGNSMEPTFSEGDKVLANRLAYLFEAPQKGDIVIAKYPDNIEKKVIKRIHKITPLGYFLTGDGDKKSADSKYFWMVKGKDIIGKVVVHRN